MTYFELQSLLSEVQPDHWLVEEEADLISNDQCTELLQTGSVEIQAGTRKFVLAFIVEEVK